MIIWRGAPMTAVLLGTVTHLCHPLPCSFGVNRRLLIWHQYSGSWGAFFAGRREADIDLLRAEDGAARSDCFGAFLSF